MLSKELAQFMDMQSIFSENERKAFYARKGSKGSVCLSDGARGPPAYAGTGCGPWTDMRRRRAAGAGTAADEDTGDGKRRARAAATGAHAACAQRARPCSRAPRQRSRAGVARTIPRR